MKIAVAQLAPRAWTVKENVERAAVSVARAAEAGADVVVLPELLDTGYVMEAVRETAAEWSGDASPYGRIRALAREHGLFVCCGLSERVEGAVHNAVAVLSPEGELVARYRKSHLFSYGDLDERTVLTPGDALETFPLGPTRAGLLVCYDLRFPELTRKLAGDGARILIAPAAFPYPREEHWRTLLTARAIENQVFVVGANRVGRDGDLEFCGRSRILDPWGEALAAMDGHGEGLLTATLDLDAVERARARMPVWRDRRPELYG